MNIKKLNILYIKKTTYEHLSCESVFDIPGSHGIVM